MCLSRPQCLRCVGYCQARILATRARVQASDGLLLYIQKPAAEQDESVYIVSWFSIFDRFRLGNYAGSELRAKILPIRVMQYNVELERKLNVYTYRDR